MNVKIIMNNIDVNKISKAEEYINECIKQKSFVLQNFKMPRCDKIVYYVREYIAELGTSYKDNFDNHVKNDLTYLRWAIRTLEKTHCEKCNIRDIRTVCSVYGYDKFDEDFKKYFKEYYENNDENKIEIVRISIMNTILRYANERILSKDNR